MADVGDRIRAARERLGLRQEDVAEMLGVDRNTVGGWETGRHSPRTKLSQIRRVLQLDAELEPIASAVGVRQEIGGMGTVDLVAHLSTLLAQAQECSAEVSRRVAVAGPAGLDMIQHGDRPELRRPGGATPHSRPGLHAS